jgi:hypothetical protein
MKNVPSIRTRQKFREHLVGTTVLRYIDDVFQAAEIHRGEVPPERAVPGQRRALIEEYYAGVNWRSPADVRKVLNVFGHILADTGKGDARDELIAALRLDGFTVADDGRIEVPPLTVTVTPVDVADPGALQAYERRIHQNLIDDMELAIGSSKELVEAVCKQLLDDASIAPDAEWSIERLFKEAAKTVNLDVDSVQPEKAGAESIRKVLRGLAMVVSGTAELRNRYGTGHGRHKRSGLQQRHADLVATCALAVARFLLATREWTRGRRSAG